MSLSTKLSAFTARVAEQFKTVTASINAVKTTADKALSGSLFKGAILPYYGTLDSTGKYPLVDGTTFSSWQICDGTNGTPDLRSKFVMGAGGGVALGSTGGSTESETVDQDSFDYSMSTSAIQTEMDIQTDLPPYVALYYVMKIN